MRRQRAEEGPVLADESKKAALRRPFRRLVFVPGFF